MQLKKIMKKAPLLITLSMILTVFSGCSESGGQLNTLLNGGSSFVDNSVQSQETSINPSSAENIYSSTTITKTEDDSRSTSSNCDFSVNDSYIEPTSSNESQANQDDHNISQSESKVERPTAESSPNAYLRTVSSTFSLAEKQVEFVDVKEITGTDFIGYELEYIMPSETLQTLKYVYVDGEVCVSDNSGDCGVIVISPKWYEKIESDNIVFWKSLIYDTPTVIYISESDVAYVASFESDADLSKAIDAIKSLV